MQQQSGKKEAEYQQIITNINRTTNENITKLKEEKVMTLTNRLRVFLMTALCRLVIPLTHSLDRDLYTLYLYLY